MSDRAVQRNFASEAVAIASGTSTIFPQREHLQVLAAQMESVLAEHRLLTEILSAAMVDTGQSQLFFPAEALAHVRKHGLNVVITQNPKTAPGAVIVELSKRPEPTPKSRVM